MEMWTLTKELKAVCDPAMDKALMQQLWKGASFGGSDLCMEEGCRNELIIGEAELPKLEKDEEYAVNVSKQGAAIKAENAGDLMRGFCALLAALSMKEKDQVTVPMETIRGGFSVGIRMVHLCIFPETSFDYIERMIRLCGMLQYTHVILEFWGMLQYDCEKALAWPCAFSKEQAKKLTALIRGFGMEPVPMFNHLGHASACRVMNGKHVALDQDPSLQYLFSADGWAWNLVNEDAFSLLKQVRAELYEVFGEGEYCHLGCDEAYIYGADPEAKPMLGDYLKKLTEEVVKEGRKPILWGDMLLCDEEVGGAPHCYCAEKDPAAAKALRKCLAKGSVIADWQYDVHEAPIRTTRFLAEQGEEVLCCPWTDTRNVKAAVDTVKEINQEGVNKHEVGVIVTTWHTLSNGYGGLWTGAAYMGMPVPRELRYAPDRTAAALLMRKAVGEFRGYENTGFAAQQVFDIH